MLSEEVPTAIPKVTADLRRALVHDVLNCDDPSRRLLTHLVKLDERQDLHSQAAIFESLIWRCDIGHFWIYYWMRKVYANLDRPDMAFMMAAQAVLCERPDGPLWPSFQEIFTYHKKTGDARAGMAAFLANAAITPEHIVAERWEIEPLAQKAGVLLD